MIPGWAGAYLVDTNTGRVRSQDRTVVDTRGRARRLQGVELVPTERVRGGRQVTLSTRGHRRAFTVDRLVALALEADR